MGNTSSKGPPIDEQWLAPWGVYPELVWDKPTQRAVKKLILDRKLAPFFPPAESKTSAQDEECPICFMFLLHSTILCLAGTLAHCHVSVCLFLDLATRLVFTCLREWSVGAGTTVAG